MKHLSMLAAGLMAFGLWSCASDEPVPGPAGGAQGDVFARLTLQLPTSTRSTTDTEDDNKNEPASSNDGKEIGKDYENNVDEIFVVLATVNEAGRYEVISSSASQAILQQTAAAPTYSVQFKSEELEKYVNSGEGTDTVAKKAYVFAFCNPTAELRTKLSDPALPGTSDIFYSTLTETNGDNLAAATKRSFLMTNALISTTSLPNLQNLISKHNTQATALDLGTVKVERVVSRFDFESKKYAASENIPDNYYVITDNVTGLKAGYVAIEAMSLFNEAKEYNVLPQISNNADWTDITLCGYELVNNWVVSPNYALKNAFATDNTYTTALQDAYFFNFTMLPKERSYTTIASLSETDEDEAWANGKDTDYMIWRYATENTLPTAAQKHAITTGIVFRGEIKPLPETMWTDSQTDYHPAKALANAMQAGETLFAWTSLEKGLPQPTMMLGSAKDVYKYAYTHNTSAIRSDFITGVANGQFSVAIDGVPVTNAESANIFPATVKADFSNVTVTAVKKFNETNPDKTYNYNGNNNFIAYEPTEDTSGVKHYYVYYYYYNRHNNNGMVGMGPMEFATVRNNVYKLKVDQVNAFGIPGDIVPPPPTDDEEPEVFFKVSVTVLDWVVRVNNIIL